MIANTITWILANVFTWTAILAVLLGFLRKPKTMNRYASILRHLFFLYVGLGFVWSGAMHLLMPAFTASEIGWANSPFQVEVGLANLSVAALGFMAFFRKDHYFWLGAIVALTIFAVGAGVGHIYQLSSQHDHAISNAGLVLYTDIIVPLVMWVLWWKSKFIN